MTRLLARRWLCAAVVLAATSASWPGAGTTPAGGGRETARLHAAACRASPTLPAAIDVPETGDVRIVVCEEGARVAGIERALRAGPVSRPPAPGTSRQSRARGLLGLTSAAATGPPTA